MKCTVLYCIKSFSIVSCGILTFEALFCCHWWILISNLYIVIIKYININPRYNTLWFFKNKVKHLVPMMIFPHAASTFHHQTEICIWFNLKIIIKSKMLVFERFAVFIKQKSCVVFLEDVLYSIACEDWRFCIKFLIIKI